MHAGLRGESAGMKVGLIGAGNVGSACLVALVMRGVAREIVVINRTHAVAKGVVTDIQYGTALFSPLEVRAGDYGDLEGAQLVLITAGINEQAGGATDRGDDAGRLRLLDKNAAVYRDVVPKVVGSAPQAVILVITDPPDPLADLARKLAGHDRVLSTGTFLDTLRFKFHLARALGVDPVSVEAQVLGEHGTSQVFVWSSARVAGVPIDAALGQSAEEAEELRKRIEHDVRYANIAIIEGTGASQLGIGLAVGRLAEMILRNEQAAIPIGVYNPRYRVTLSLPTVVGRSGAARVFEPDLTEAEQRALDASADTLRRAVARLDS
jgi:L-lactate dehydrogenase